MRAISLTNEAGIDAPRRIDLEIEDPDDEGWRTYRMTLVANSSGDVLVSFGGSFDRDDALRLAGRLTDLLEAQADGLTFEPIEPAFSISVTRCDEDAFDLECIVDLSFVSGGPGTETGVGFRLRTSATDLSAVRDAVAS